MNKQRKDNDSSTDIYHIVKFTEDSSIYIFFKNCNLSCRGCIKKNTPWDSHISNEDRKKLPKLKDVETLDLERLKAMINPMKIKRAVLGGGEPTVDPNIHRIIHILNKEGIYPILLTNAYDLEEKFTDKLVKYGLKEICISMKSIDEKVHKKHTSVPNERILKNFKLLTNKRIKIRAESVLIPGLVGTEEIERIAEFISRIDPKIPLRIDPFKEVPSLDYPTPSQAKIREALAKAEKHLENVHYVNPKASASGKVSILYPNVQKRDER